MRDLTYEEYELVELAAKHGFTVTTDHAAPSGRATLGPKSGHFDSPAEPHEFEGTIVACHAWLAGWIARSTHDRPALLAFDAIRNVLCCESCRERAR